MHPFLLIVMLLLMLSANQPLKTEQEHEQDNEERTARALVIQQAVGDVRKRLTTQNSATPGREPRVEAARREGEGAGCAGLHGGPHSP